MLKIEINCDIIKKKDAQMKQFAKKYFTHENEQK